MGASNLASQIHHKLLPKELGAFDIALRAGKWADKAAGYGPVVAPPAPPAPAPPESVDEGAYIARDRSRRRALLANKGSSGASAAYSPAPKRLTGS